MDLFAPKQKDCFSEFKAYFQNQWHNGLIGAGVPAIYFSLINLTEAAVIGPLTI